MRNNHPRSRRWFLGLWDYVNRAMPFDHPSTLTPDEVYSATAYVLFLNGIVGGQDLFNETTLPKVQMPNRNGFVGDPRPDIPLKKKLRRPSGLPEAS